MCTRESLDSFLDRGIRKFKTRDGSSIYLTRPVHLNLEIKQSSADGEDEKSDDHDAFSGVPISFVEKNPGAQLLTGSFHPVEDDKVLSSRFEYAYCGLQWAQLSTWHVAEKPPSDSFEALFARMRYKAKQLCTRLLVDVITSSTKGQTTFLLPCAGIVLSYLQPIEYARWVARAEEKKSEVCMWLCYTSYLDV